MTLYNKEINELRTATNECSSEVPKILHKFIKGIGELGIALSKEEQDEITELTDKFWKKCACRYSEYSPSSKQTGYKMTISRTKFKGR